MAKILIVEDDNFLLDIYVHIFKKYGHEVETAMDGEIGIQKAKHGQYDLVLLDILLPKKNGILVVRSLRRKGSPAIKTPIILLSNLGQERIIRQAYKFGANGYLLKADLLPREIVKKVEDYLHGKIKTEDFLPSKSST